MSQVTWYTARASGLVAWGLVLTSIVWGLLLATKVLGRKPGPAWILSLHRFLGGLAIAFVGVHVAAILLDTYTNFGVADVLVPFASSWHPIAVAWGIVATYLLVAIEITSLVRHRLTVRAWRNVHLLSYFLFATATIHMVTAGTDVRAVLATTAAVLLGVMAALGSTALWLWRSEPARAQRSRAPSASGPGPDVGGASVGTMPATPSDHRSAAAIATRAGELLVELRGVLDEHDAHIGLRRALGDKAAHDFIVDALARTNPDDAVLSEEGADDPARLASSRVWIVDPLDGTREYSEEGRSDWAVHVALVIDGEVAAAAVALPAHGITLTADPPPPPPPRRDGPPLLVVSRSRPPAVAAALAHHLDGLLYPLGSAGAKAMAVVLGEADVYAHSGGQYEWDSAAPIGVAAAAGLHVSRLDGSPLVYNRPDPWLPDLLICRPELAERALEITTRY